MTTIYSSETHKNLDPIAEVILLILMISVIAWMIIYVINGIYYQILASIVWLLICFLQIRNMYKRTFSIYFLENEIIVKYRFIKKELNIQYSDIYEYKYLNAARSPEMNQLRYIQNNKKKRINYSSIDYNKYIEFVKWLKSRNKEIEFTVYPSDHYMNHRLQEEFGFKYRKFLKKTL
nr:hypothetical protein [uncultured Allomuricauda sp.]